MAVNTRKNMVTVGSLALDGKARLRVIDGGKGDSRRSSARVAPRHTLPIFCCVAIMMLAICLTWLQVDRITNKRVAQAFAKAPVETVTVMPGDSIWQIAEEHPVAGCTTAQLVNHIIDANGLEDSMLRPGMRLSVPGEPKAC